MRNESTLDRIVRTLVGLSLLLVGFFWLGGVWQFVLYLLGAVLLLTGIVGFCPLYRVCSISTYRKEAKPVGRVMMTLFILLLGLLLIGGRLDRYGLADPAAGKAIGTFVNPALQTLYDQLVERGTQNLANALTVGANM